MPATRHSHAHFACLSALVLTLLLLPVPADSQPTCGFAFRDLLRYCAQPDRASPSKCCHAVRLFNDALCWCQPAALAAASRLAANQYAFALRAEFCDVSAPYRPSFPARNGPPTPDTCPPAFASLPANASQEGCPAPAQLRARREAAVEKLDGLRLAGVAPEDVKAFRDQVEGLMVEDVLFSSIGLSYINGVGHATDLLLSRQDAVGSEVDWSGGPEVSASVKGKFWQTPDMVSYSVDFVGEDGFFTSRLMFVGFEKCSNKMRFVFTAEPGVIESIASQFYYPSVPADTISQYDVSAKEVCDKIESACGDRDDSPFATMQACIEHVTAMKGNGQVLCNNFDREEVPVLGLYGDTVGCKYSHALAAVAEPAKICPLLGATAGGVCAKEFCSNGEYADIFQSSGPRFTGSSSFTCNTGTGVCTENWPQ